MLVIAFRRVELQKVANQMTVAAYCAAFARGDIVVNKDYQRSDKVWPDSARGYLIETIIQGYPVPKMYLYPKTDLRSRRTISEIVDGQQRSMSVFAFFNDKFRLPKTLETKEIAGRIYSELDDEYKQKFIDYSLSFDEFLATTREEIVEVFRRMNSYTIPLNAEEHRHAVFQGPFKWFVNRLSTRFNKIFVETGLFSEKQLVRMGDAKLLSEVCDALLHGIRTTNKRILDNLYKENDKQFPTEKVLDRQITETLDQISAWKKVYETNVVKPYIFYTLILAVIHQRYRVDQLEGLYASNRMRAFDTDLVERNLLQLSDALDKPDESEDFEKFIAACTEKTNTREQRSTRFEWLCRALVEPEFP